MKQKGRYNIKVAQKKGVVVEKSDDIDAYMSLVEKTGKRDGFTTLSRRAYETFLHELPGSFLLLAYPVGQIGRLADWQEHQRNAEPIAGLLGITWNNTAYYYYGASDHDHRALMAPYALQWEAMKKSKAAGALSYDLLGVAPANEPHHPWAGITQFKERFGGAYMEYPQEQQVVLRPFTQKLIRWKRKLVG